MVVNTPALVIVPGTCPVAPPGILVAFGIEMAEGINKAVVDKVVYPFSLHRKEARGVFQPYRIVDIDLPVTDVVIAPNDDVGDLFLQLIYVHLKMSKSALRFLPSISI